MGAPVWASAAALSLLSAAVPMSASENAALHWKRGEYQKAIKYWVGAAKAEDRDAFYNLGQAHLQGKGVSPNQPAALGFFRKAADLGHPQAREQLGLLLYADKDRRMEAIPFLVTAAAKGSHKAAYVLGVACIRGEEVEKDLARAFVLLSKAAEGGIEQARKPLAQLRASMTAADRRRALILTIDG